MWFLTFLPMAFAIVTIKRHVLDDTLDLTYLVPKQTRSGFRRFFDITQGFESEIELGGTIKKLWMECDDACHCRASISQASFLGIPRWSNKQICALAPPNAEPHCFVSTEVHFTLAVQDGPATLGPCQVSPDIPFLTMESSIEPRMQHTQGLHSFMIPKTKGSWMLTATYDSEPESPKLSSKHVFALTCDQTAQHYDMCDCQMTLYTNTLGGRNQIACDVFTEGALIAIEADLHRSRSRSVSGEASPGALRRISTTLEKHARDMHGNCRIQVNADLLQSVLENSARYRDVGTLQHAAYDQICSSLPVNFVYHGPIAQVVPGGNRYIIMKSTIDDEHRFPLLGVVGASVSCTSDCACFLHVGRHVTKCGTVYTNHVSPVNSCMVLAWDHFCSNMVTYNGQEE